MRPPILASLALAVLAGLAGCKSDPSAPPAPAASSAPVSNACPSPPDWASDLPGNLLVEVLYIPASTKEHKGTGYRIYEDGRFDTFGDVEFQVDDKGRPQRRVVEAKWRNDGGIGGQKLDGLVKLVGNTAHDDLDGWARGRPRQSKDPVERTFISAKQGGKWLRACFLGTPSPPGLGALENEVRDLLSSIKK